MFVFFNASHWHTLFRPPIDNIRALQGTEGSIPRSKPFKYTYEKEIVMYAYFKKLDYFSTECIYSPNAYRQVSDMYFVRFVLFKAFWSALITAGLLDAG